MDESVMTYDSSDELPNGPFLGEIERLIIFISEMTGGS